MIRPSYPPGAKILFVTGSGSEKEIISGKALHPESHSGRTFNKLLANANLTRYDVGVTAVVKDRIPGGRESFLFEDPKKMTIPKPAMLKCINDLRTEISLHKPNIVVALGRTALWALTGEEKLGAARGYIMDSSILPGTKVLGTFDPYAVFKEFKHAFTSVMDIRKAVRESLTPALPVERRELHAFATLGQFRDYINWLIHDHKEPVSLDIESTQSGHLDIIGLGASPTLGMSFTTISGGKPTLSVSDEFQLWRLLGHLFRTKILIMHNGLYDMAAMWYRLGILASGYTKDTMVATHICWPEQPRSLSYISSICLSVPKWKHTAADAPSVYNCEDTTNTYGCWEFLSAEMDKHNHWPTFDFEMRQVWVASMLQLQGVPIDREKQKELVDSTKKELTYVEQDLIQEVGRPLNFNSHVQVGKLLYDELKLPVKYKRKKRKEDPDIRTTDADALQALERETHNPILGKILSYKRLHKLLTSFLDIELSPEGRVHTSYNITGAKMETKTKKGLILDDDEQHKSFGRWSSSASIIIPYGSGNLQNIPGTARVMYTAPDGQVYLQADYKQAEAVVVSYEILDLPMIQLFKDSFGLTTKECKARNLDIHKLTAARNFRLPLDQITSELRDIGKTIRHATSYSAGPKVLANKLGCTMSHAKVLLTSYHNGCPQLGMWHKKIQELLRKTRRLTNLLGRNHKFERQWGDDLFRSAYSYIPQSTVGDLLNLALIRLYENYGDELTIALQLHDAIYCMVPEDLADWAATVMKQCMLIPLTSSHGEKYYIDVDFKIGKSWGELEDFEPNYTHQITL